MQRLYRPTSFGLAFVEAVAKVDHQTVRPDNWVARRAVHNMLNTKIGMTAEPTINARLSHKTYIKLAIEGRLPR